MQLKTAQETF